MYLVDKIIRDFKDKCRMEGVKVVWNLTEKFNMIKMFILQVSTLKDELENLSIDGRLYLDYKLRKNDVDLRLCPDFYVFFHKNSRFYFSCCKNNKSKTSRRGKIINYS